MNRYKSKSQQGGSLYTLGWLESGGEKPQKTVRASKDAEKLKPLYI